MRNRASLGTSTRAAEAKVDELSRRVAEQATELERLRAAMDAVAAEPHPQARRSGQRRRGRAHSDQLAECPGLVSRRRLFGLLGGAAAAGAGATLLTGSPAGAVTNLVIDGSAATNAGTATTNLSSTTTGTAMAVAATGVGGEGLSGTGGNATTGIGGIGLEGTGGSGGTTAGSGGGNGVQAQGGPGVASGANGGLGVFAHGGVAFVSSGTGGHGIFGLGGGGADTFCNGGAGVVGNGGAGGSGGTSGVGVAGMGGSAGRPGAGVTGSSSLGYGMIATGGLAPIRLTPQSSGTGPPSGAHAAGELFVDSTGALFYCTADGTPGTWVHQSPLVTLATPARVYDSRMGTQPSTGPKSQITNGTTVSIDVTGPKAGGGNSGVPSGVTAVLGNITLVNGPNTVFLTVFAAGATPPATSNVNATGGGIVANNFTSQIGTSNQISIQCGLGPTDFIIDIFGYYP
jgi:hypothetical protein